MRKKPKFNIYEEKILRIMRMFYDEKTIYEISTDSNIHWKTAERHIKNLVKKEAIVEKKSGKKKYYQAVFFEN